MNIRLKIACETIRTRAVELYHDYLLDCKCAICSTSIFKFCLDNKIECSFHYGRFKEWPHCWVVHDKHIYDITATQFDIIYEPVLILPIQNDIYKTIAIFDRETDIYNYLMTWPEDQKPLPETLERLNDRLQTC